MQNHYKNNNSFRAALTIAEIRSKFEKEMNISYEFIRPDPLISPIFPTSFTPSAGPNLAARSFSSEDETLESPDEYVIQPCIRYWDIDVVGDFSHLSFFEMATCVSQGGKDRIIVIGDVFNFLIEYLNLAPEYIWTTVYAGGKVAGTEFVPDSEAESIWLKLGVKPSHIVPVFGQEGFVANKQEPVGGYRTELYIEMKNTHFSKSETCKPGTCTCGRFIELATSVTYSFIVDFDNKVAIIPVDGAPVHAAGFGVERLAAIIYGSGNVKDVDVIRVPVSEIAKLIQNSEVHAQKKELFIKLVDSVRGLVFLITEGADNLPGKANKGRRWIINKYIRHLWSVLEALQVDYEKTLTTVCNSVLKIYQPHYSFLDKSSSQIVTRLISLIKRLQ